MSASPLALPPVRLLPVDVLARQALAAPLLDRVLRLTRWTGEQRRVDGMGELLEDELAAAVEVLGLSGEEGAAEAAQAWGVAVDAGLLVLEIDEEAEESTPPGEAAGRAVPGELYARIGGGDAADGTDADPYDVLDLWLVAVECALAEATAPDYHHLSGEADGDGEPITPEDADREAEEEAELLDAALVNLYALSAIEPVAEPGAGEADGGARESGDHEDLAEDGHVVPLPVLAASLVVPEEMDQPSEDVLEEVTEVMLLLDDHFRLLESTGLLAYAPMDEALIEEADDDGVAVLGGGSGEPDDDEIARYGAVRLTPLGVYGVRERLADAGAHAPVLGDLAEVAADDLLGALGSYPDHAVRYEAEAWLAGRKPSEAAAELLAAAGEDGAEGPTRRLVCQQVLALLGTEAEPAVRDVLDDLHLGGLARVWLTERQLPDVPAPSTDMVYWLTIDTIAAQLAADGDSDELASLITDLVARHEAFFADAWRVDHPATAAVLEAIGRLHPDRPTAKASRKAAFKARSRPRR
ncbi:hypothetical protein SAMN05216223_101714 [Actinacidiphila yanglinensis]|uniref:Uncharacterized protein n=1 Tax=Actinacidiphila yanglinensis TaxID=310779 RepID=A0A1H5TZX2_9ACTN|nr:hypothetical protein [Actinacidiphila yanglinensis]SEF68290.1 hypothetical protein SAMN05216223_101714 [Actinacidiphila yanglinensis]